MIEVNQTFRLLSKGIFAVDKTKNATSVEVLESLKTILTKEISPKHRPHPLKLGHGGTLDHTATGVLVVGVCFGCKLLSKFLAGDKKYIATGRFGIETDTLNETGVITQQKSYDHITQDMLRNALHQFKGNIMQTPPIYSALKRKGVRLSDLAREGCPVSPQARPVVCHEIECINFSAPEFSLLVSCGGGFYIRSLVHDLGKVLGSCAHVTALRRIQQGPFKEAEALPQERWNAKDIISAIKLNKGGRKQLTYYDDEDDDW